LQLSRPDARNHRKSGFSPRSYRREGRDVNIAPTQALGRQKEFFAFAKALKVREIAVRVCVTNAEDKNILGVGMQWIFDDTLF
jgi:hypothetical protein